MYRFSRSIYRELSPRVIEDDRDPTGCENKQKVLDACEGAIRRLACDRRYFARPARSLFSRVLQQPVCRHALQRRGAGNKARRAVLA